MISMIFIFVLFPDTAKVPASTTAASDTDTCNAFFHDLCTPLQPHFYLENLFPTNVTASFRCQIIPVLSVYCGSVIFLFELNTLNHIIPINQIGISENVSSRNTLGHSIRILSVTISAHPQSSDTIIAPHTVLHTAAAVPYHQSAFQLHSQ